jgi:hypothetical protein
MHKFLSLGSKCVKIQETSDASQGIFLCACDYLTCFHPCFYRLVMSLSLLAAALVMAHARISALEAELKASREA